MAPARRENRLPVAGQAGGALARPRSGPNTPGRHETHAARKLRKGRGLVGARGRERERRERRELDGGG